MTRKTSSILCFLYFCIKGCASFGVNKRLATSISCKQTSTWDGSCSRQYPPSSTSGTTRLCVFGFDNISDDEEDNVEEEFDVDEYLRERERRKQNSGSDSSNNEDEKSLTSEFFQTLRMRNIGRNTRASRRKLVSLDSSTNDPDKNSDKGVNEDGEDDDDYVREITASELNLFTGVDEGGVGKLAGNVTITNKELYDSLKERVLESPTSFQKLTTGADESDDGTMSATGDSIEQSKTYVPPKNVPDAELTAGEVVTVVLEALRNNDNPSTNRGVEILFAYSSSASILADLERAPSVEEYGEMLRTSPDQKILLEHVDVLFDKADYSQDKKRAFITVRLMDMEKTLTSVNFILSTGSSDDCWLIDSHLVRPRGLRRGKRW